MKSICSIADLLGIIKIYMEYLSDKVTFAPGGWPILKREWFLDQWPDRMITYQNRKNGIITDRNRTVLCFYSKDSLLYPRLTTVFNEIDEYRSFLGVVGLDITVTMDMDVELQRTIILANQLFMTILAVNGIKVVLNTRCGSRETMNCFRHLPHGLMCASGFLGCRNAKSFRETIPYIDKLLTLRPDKLLIYGKQDILVNQQLNALGFDYKYYDDFHRLSQGRQE